MKSAIISDIHFGIKNDSEVALDYYQRFFEKTFFPTLIEQGIDHVFDLGDPFHNRHKINTKTLNRAREMFYDRLEEYKINLDVIVGNHCCHYLNTNKVNTPSLVLGDYENVTVHAEPFVWENCDGKILLVPWINKENADHVSNLLKTTSATVAMGHFEIAGLYLNRYQIAEHGLNIKTFNRFNKVFSGHFHTKSTKGPVTYVGSCFQHTWIDAAEEKFFHIYDHETRELEPIANPFSLFDHVIYNNGGIEDIDTLEGKYVKLFVNDITSATHLQETIEKIEQHCVDLAVIYNHKSEIDVIDEEAVEQIDVEDTLSIIQKVVKDEGVQKILVNSYKENV